VKRLTFFLITTLFAALPVVYAQSQTEKPKAAVYIMGNPEGRDALRMAVNNYLIKSGQYQMIAVDAIDVVAKEHTRQTSGSVSDEQIAKLGQDAGAKYVCVVERTELDGISYVATRMVSVESKVAELSEMAVLPKGGIIIDFVKKQVGAMLGMEAGSQPAVAAPTPPPPPPQPAVYTAPAAAPSPPPKAEQIAVTSNPSGATVNVNGKTIGVTPCSFKPAAWGKYTIVVSMSGYEKATKIVEFEGGTLNVPFSLSLSKTIAAPAPSVPSQAAVSGASIFITSLPPKAAVYIGGKFVGNTNEGELQVPVGTHQVRLMKDGLEATETMTFNPGKNPTRFVNLSSSTLKKPTQRDAEESADELAALMNALPVPAQQISTSGEFKSHAYLNAVRSKIERNWNPATENRNIAVVVSFEIHRDGSVHAARVTSSSGNAVIDKCGIDAVMHSSPFSKLPPNVEGDKLEIIITLRPTRYMR
jgi:outer membrane biosynthesis protein TonB